jgi:hypothetical protein
MVFPKINWAIYVGLKVWLLFFILKKDALFYLNSSDFFQNNSKLNILWLQF